MSAPEFHSGAASAADRPASADGKPPAYAIFEGGGAKGITHVGALKALRDNYWLVGAAGASAGAIVATLAAAGFRAAELFDDQKNTDILALHQTSPVGLLGPAAWRRFRFAWRWLPLSLTLSGYALLAFVYLAIVDSHWLVVSLTGILVLALLVPAVTLAYPVIARGGFLTTEAMRDKLDEILRKRLLALYKKNGIERAIGDYVTFEDIAPETIEETCRLRIVVTDASRRELVQFDERTPAVSVADAVAASAALPLVFRPPEIRGLDGNMPKSVFVDGGLVSNLPVWAFITEKKIFERGYRAGNVPIFAFTLNAPSEEEPECPSGIPHEEGIGNYLRDLGRALLRLPLEAALWLARALEWLILLVPRLFIWCRRRLGGNFSILRHLRDVIESGIFGSQTVVQDFVPDLHVVDMASPLTTISFDCSRTAATEAYRAGLTSASTWFANRRRQAEDTAQLLQALLPAIRERVTERRLKAGQPAPTIRLSLVEQAPAGSFQVVASVGMDEDADDRMEFDASCSAAPSAFRDRVATLAPFDDSKRSIKRVMTKYERALLRPDRYSVISVPVYRPVDDAIPEALSERIVDRVLCVDSNDDLQPDFDNTTFMNWLGRQAMILVGPEREKE